MCSPTTRPPSSRAPSRLSPRTTRASRTCGQKFARNWGARLRGVRARIERRSRRPCHSHCRVRAAPPIPMQPAADSCVQSQVPSGCASGGVVPRVRVGSTGPGWAWAHRHRIGAAPAASKLACLVLGCSILKIGFCTTHPAPCYCWISLPVSSLEVRKSSKHNPYPTTIYMHIDSVFNVHCTT